MKWGLHHTESVLICTWVTRFVDYGVMMLKRSKLIQTRKASRISQSEMADILQISASYYGSIERGERNPTLRLAKNIADLLLTTVDDLFFENKSHKTCGRAS